MVLVLRHSFGKRSNVPISLYDNLVDNHPKPSHDWVRLQLGPDCLLQLVRPKFSATVVCYVISEQAVFKLLVGQKHSRVTKKCLAP